LLHGEHQSCQEQQESWTGLSPWHWLLRPSTAPCRWRILAPRQLCPVLFDQMWPQQQKLFSAAECWLPQLLCRAGRNKGSFERIRPVKVRRSSRVSRALRFTLALALGGSLGLSRGGSLGLSLLSGVTQAFRRLSFAIFPFTFCVAVPVSAGSRLSHAM
jgi:hypothetical protein